MTALEYLRLFAPEFSDVPDATVNQWLTVAGTFVPVMPDDDRQAMVTALYAAHMMALSARGSSVGSVTSEKEGDLSRSFSEVKTGSAYLGQTGYGLQYLDAIKTVAGVGIMTRGSYA